jgi:hypothetical protein
MKYDEYAEYQEFALHIDIDTSMCGFTEKNVPQYVANLMDSETDKDHKAVVRFIASPPCAASHTTPPGVNRIHTWAGLQAAAPFCAAPRLGSE